MKNLVLSLLPVLCLSFPAFAAGKAAPAPYQAVIRAELEAKSSKAYTGGSLSVDGRSGEVEVTLQPRMPDCADGMMCAQVMPEPITYNLSHAVSETDDLCGIIHTRAVRDDRPVDGAYLSILINNNRGNTCPTLLALAPLEVVIERKYYDRFQGKEISQIDTFEAQDFALINPAGKDQDLVFNGKLVSARYQDKKLNLKLQYAGGCAEHAFDLKWGTCKDVKLLNSVISECEVTILETAGKDDSCEALQTKTHTIDLSGLAQAYIINLNGTRVLVH